MSMKFKNPIEVDGYVSAEYADLSTTTSHSVSVGEIAWNATDGTFDMGLIGGVTLQAGQEMHIYGKATEAISNGDAVMFGGVQGEHLLLSKADATTINANPEYFIGVSTQDFATNDFGYVTVFGKVRTLNTTGYSLGAVLYYDSTTSTDGKLTATEPSAPNAKIIVAAVVKVHATQGVLMVRPHIMPTLSEIQDVNTSLSKTTPVNTDNLLLQDSADQSIWKKLSWSNLKATLKSYFDTIYQSVLTNPITGTGTTNYVPKFTGSTTLGNSQIFDNGTNVGIGDSNPGYKLTVIGNGYFNDNVLIGNGSQLRFTIPGINIKPELVSSTWSDLSFSTNNSEKMRITSAGNVGIGTTTPQSALSIGTNHGTLISIGQPIWANNIVLRTGWDGSDFTQLQVPANGANSANITLRNSGNVGIGTSSPGTPLDIRGTNGIGVRFIETTTGNTNRIQIGTGNGFGYIDATAGVGSTYLSLQVASTERMRITSDGNVGIGTSSPSERLEVQNGASGAKIKVSNSSGGYATLECSSNATSVAQLSFTNQLSLIGGNVGIGTTSPNARFTTLTNAAGWAGWIENQDTSGNGSGLVVTGASDSGGISFFVRKQDGTGTFAVLGNGNVGIGTSSPSALLNVIGDVHLGSYSNSSTVNLENRTSKGIFIISTDGVTNAAGTTITYSWANGGHGPLKFNNASSEVMRLAANGNVGIGTSIPTAKLHVAGQTYLDNGASNALTINTEVSDTTTRDAIYLYEQNAQASGRQAISWYNGNQSYYKARIWTEVGVGYGATTFGIDVADDSRNVATRLAIRNGNVGVGTSAPTARFQVGDLYRVTSDAVTTWGITNGNGILSWDANLAIIGGLANTAVQFRANNTEFMRLTTSGNLGIGTSSPTSKLTVNDSTAFSWGFPSLASVKIGTPGTGGSFMVMTPSLNSSYESGFAVDGTYNSGKSVINLSAFGVYSGGPYSADIAFKTATNTTLSEKMRITSAGNVGIGTTAPSEKLHVNGSVLTSSLKTSLIDATADPLNIRVDGSIKMHVGYNSIAVYSNTLVDLSSTNQPLALPQMYYLDIINYSSPIEGMIVYAIDTGNVMLYRGSGWANL